MRLKLVAGNWKMNLTKDTATSLIKRLKEADNPEGVIVGAFVPAIHIPLCLDHLKDKMLIGAQNCYEKQSGAFTGELSPAMIKSYNCSGVLIGHSERRKLFHEDNALLKGKVNAALEEKLSILFCFGENLEERESGKEKEVVKTQLEESLFHLHGDQMEHISLAYEPVWAIGTGKAATPAQAQEMHAYIRSLIAEKYGDSVAQDTTIVYGGSVKPGNAEEIFANPDIDGGLIGGASLIADDFTAIVNAMPKS